VPVDGRIKQYFWEIKSLIASHQGILAFDHAEFIFPEDDTEVYFTHYLEGCLIFKDESKLLFNIGLGFDERFTVIEKRYCYGYFDSKGERIVQYDNAPHHLRMKSFPHHLHKGERPKKGKEKIYECDLETVNFVSVFQKVRDKFLRW